MSILIKGMKMPSCCENCPCNDDDWRCGALGSTFDDLEIDRLEIKPSFCPLVEVPEPHGRLIDADALNLDYEVNMADDWKTAHEIANCVRYAPTVIEAEEQEHDE